MAYAASFVKTEQHQSEPGVRAYNSQDQLDRRLSDPLSHDLTSGSVEITEDQMREAAAHVIENCDTAGRSLTIPAGDGTTQGPIFVLSDAANANSCELIKGATSYIIGPGERRSFWNEPDVDGLIEIAGEGGGSIVVPTSKVKSFSGARVRRNATFSETRADFNKLDWNTEVFDVGGWHDNGVNNERLTVPAGVTRVIVGLDIYANNNPNQYAGIDFFITRNGSEVVHFHSAFFYDNQDNGFWIATEEIDVEEGDYFEAWFVFWEDTDTIALTAGTFNSFWIMATAESSYGVVAARDVVTDFIEGTPTGNATVYEELLEVPVNFLDAFSGSYAHCGTNPSTDTDFDVQLEGVSIGTLSFDSGGNATFTGGDVVSDAGDRFSLVAPGSLNGVADIAAAFRGYYG